MAVTLRYFTEFGKHTFQHITAASSCGVIYAGVYCILYHVYDVVVKKVHVRYLISWWVSCMRKKTQWNSFTSLHGMQTRSSDENCLSVRLSIRLSVCRTRGLWQNGSKICPDLYTVWKNILPSFLRRRMVGGGRPLLPEILGQPAPVGAKFQVQGVAPPLAILLLRKLG